MLTGAVLFSASLFSYVRIDSITPQALKSKTDAKLNTQKLHIQKLPLRSEYLSRMMVISIPKINLEAKVMDGTGKSMLKLGPGLYEHSDLPVHEKSNVCIAAHRDIYNAWFHDIDKLQQGDTITLYFMDRCFNYKVSEKFITHKKDWDVTRSLGYDAVTLTSCYPHNTSKQRIIVRGTLVTPD